LLPDPAFFHDLVKGLFIHRRKFLRSALASARKELDKPQIDALLSELGHGPTARAETLTIQQFRELSEAIRQRQPGATA
jgi:16S rRNA (adenine1518-N6/adenine1519-N6)-dimethyltransferase